MLLGLHMRDIAWSLSGRGEQKTGKSTEGPDGKTSSPTLKAEAQKAPYFGKTLHDHLLNDYLANRFMR